MRENPYIVCDPLNRFTVISFTVRCELDDGILANHKFGECLRLQTPLSKMSDEEIELYVSCIARMLHDSLIIERDNAIGNVEKNTDFEETPSKGTNDVSVGDVIYTVDYTVDTEIGTEDYVINERTVTVVDKNRSVYTTIDSRGAESTVEFTAAFRTMQEAQDEQKARYAAEGWI